jgi:hypothetical protein
MAETLKSLQHLKCTANSLFRRPIASKDREHGVSEELIHNAAENQYLVREHG